MRLKGTRQCNTHSSLSSPLAPCPKQLEKKMYWYKEEEEQPGQPTTKLLSVLVLQHMHTNDSCYSWCSVCLCVCERGRGREGGFVCSLHLNYTPDCASWCTVRQWIWNAKITCPLSIWPISWSVRVCCSNHFQGWFVNGFNGSYYS